jgi:hypothetical protein
MEYERVQHQTQPISSPFSQETRGWKNPLLKQANYNGRYLCSRHKRHLPTLGFNKLNINNILVVPKDCIKQNVQISRSVNELSSWIVKFNKFNMH